MPVDALVEAITQNRKPMAEEELFKLALDDWLGVLGRLWEAVGKSVERDRLMVYRRELAEIPLGLLERAVSRCIRENQYNNVPTIGDLWAAVRKELGEPYDVSQAIREWVERQWERGVLRFDLHRPMAAARSPKSIGFGGGREGVS